MTSAVAMTAPPVSLDTLSPPGAQMEVAYRALRYRARDATRLHMGGWWSREDAELAIRAEAQRMGVSVGSIRRLLDALVCEGWVIQDRAKRQFYALPREKVDELEALIKDVFKNMNAQTVCDALARLVSFDG